jgi:DNA polymerase III subunit epsilon
VEGTLSLFDWRPAPPAADVRPPEPAEAASPCEPTIIVFDCETTGIDFTRDQVIELCVQHGLDARARSQTWRIKPGVPIHPAAQAVHGITMADLEPCPPFAAFADEIAAVFAVADVIVGYNLSFDIDMLQAEYSRLGKPLLDLAGKKIVDAFRLWQQCEPRSLQHAHRRFVGDEFAAAHSASADVAATGRVLVGMLQHFNLEHHDWSQIASVCDPGRASWLGPSRHLRWENEIIVLGFGKHLGMPLHELAAGPDRSFLRWVIEKDFPPHVGDICRAALELPCDELVAWARTRFGTPPAPAAAPATPATDAGTAGAAGAPTTTLAAGSGPVAKPRAKRPRGANGTSTNGASTNGSSANGVPSPTSVDS